MQAKRNLLQPTTLAAVTKGDTFKLYFNRRCGLDSIRPIPNGNRRCAKFFDPWNAGARPLQIRDLIPQHGQGSVQETNVLSTPS